MANETWQQARELCLAQVKKHCECNFPDALIDKLRAEAEDNFKNNHRKWPANREKVLLSSGFVGKIAGHLAKDANSSVVSDANAHEAIKIVKSVCTAGLDERRGRVRNLFAWCPGG